MSEKSTMLSMAKINLTEDEVRKISKVSGIYLIHFETTFSRLRGKTDVLYIGRAKDLRKRLMTFFGKGKRKALCRFTRLQELGHQLYFSIEECGDYKTREVERIRKFEEDHLELPPLNHKG